MDKGGRLPVLVVCIRRVDQGAATWLEWWPFFVGIDITTSCNRYCIAAL